jgi:hypothetical protein
MAVLPYHHPLELVKRLGTLDVLSNGRVIVGVGVGSLEAEFALLGHPFDGRGERADDAIAAIRSAWGQRLPHHNGPHYQFSGFIVEPSGLPRPVSVWVGGRTRRSLRRAISLGDAWMPFRLVEPELHKVLSDPEIIEQLAARSTPLELIFAPEPPIDPVGNPEETRAKLQGYVDLGATGLSLRFVHNSPAHFTEQIEATAEIAAVWAHRGT